MGETTIAYVSKGRLRLKRGVEPPRNWSSPFADQVQEHYRSIQRRHAWKNQGRGARFATWGQPMEEDLPGASEQVTFSAITGGRDQTEILYILQTASVSAILALDAVADEPDELRLYHTADLRITDLSMGPDRDRIAASVTYGSGATNLAVLTRDGSHLTDITEGDSIDAAPRWASAGVLVYQSAGIGRDQAGLLAGRAPFAVCRVDLEQGEVEELASSATHDLLTPAEDASGALYFVRRPYTPPGEGPGLRDLALDILLFPLRLGRAILAWLDFFVVRYTGKPLTSAGGPRREGPDEKTLFLLGNMVDVEKARRESLAAGDPTPGLVPQDWELVRRVDGREEVLAHGVLAFHVDPGGQVWFTNGNGVFRLEAGGGRTLLFEDERVVAVYVVGSE